jgi:uncharacterized protein (TIGR02996 family)
VEPYFRELPGSLPFLQRIAEHPDDLPLRLALADWLQGKGREARAEFVRVQCRLLDPAFRFAQLWSGTARGEGERLRVRAENLFLDHGEEWLDGLPGADRLGYEHFTGGLLEALVVPVGNLSKRQWQELLGLADWRRLVVQDSWQNVRRLLRSPECPRFLSLDVRGYHADAREARELADSPRLASLTSLDLHDSKIGDEGAKALADSAHLAQLSFLNLFNNGIGDTGT